MSIRCCNRNQWKFLPHFLLHMFFLYCCFFINFISALSNSLCLIRFWTWGHPPKAFLTSMRGNSGFILMILAVKYCENMRIVEWSPQSLSVDYKSILQWCIGTNIRMGVEIDKKRRSIPIERWLNEKKTSIALTSYNSKTIIINARFIKQNSPIDELSNNI